MEIMVNRFTEEAAIFVVFLCGLLALGLLAKSGIRKIQMRLNELRIKRANDLVYRLYTEDINPFYISMQYREDQKIAGDEYTYGEVVVSSFAELLKMCKPIPGEIFYDLGCGAGKAVFTAALCFPLLRCKGVELLPPLYELCVDLNQQFNQLAAKDSLFKKNKFNIEFINENLLRYDFISGNIFFLNATCFRDEDWKNLENKLAKLRAGTRFIVVTRMLTNAVFELIQSGTYRMSWGPSSVFIYEKKE